MEELCKHNLPLLLDGGDSRGLTLRDGGLAVSLYFDLDHLMGLGFGDLVTTVHVYARERKRKSESERDRENITHPSPFLF